MYSIQDRLIQDNPSTDYAKLNQNEEHINENNYDDGDISVDVAPFEENKDNQNPMETFVKIDNEYEKKFGRLYKTFDVRFVKSKIWESFSSLTNLKSIDDINNIEFKDIIGTVTNSMTKELINKISTPTCFVCLLHLSNEKSIFYFLIRRSHFRRSRRK